MDIISEESINDPEEMVINRKSFRELRLRWEKF